MGRREGGRGVRGRGAGEWGEGGTQGFQFQGPE